MRFDDYIQNHHRLKNIQSVFGQRVILFSNKILLSSQYNNVSSLQIENVRL